MANAWIQLEVDRDSVCAGDDCQSHLVKLSVPSEATLLEVITQAQQACDLADIAGGKATWLVDTQGYGKDCVGVVAQQWKAPKITLDPSITAAQIWPNQRGSLYFRYWCQSDPDAVFTAIQSGGELPSRYA